MRLHATDDCTVLGERVVGEDELGNELTESDAPLAQARGRVDTGSKEFVVQATGERVRETPTITLPLQGTDPMTGEQVAVLDVVEAGQDVTIGGGETTYRIDEVDTLRGRGHRVERVQLSVRKHN